MKKFEYKMLNIAVSYFQSRSKQAELDAKFQQ